MKDSTWFKIFFFLFLAMGCIAFWLWLIEKNIFLAMAVFLFIALALVSLFFQRSAKKFNL